jgi:hypothetical protein
MTHTRAFDPALFGETAIDAETAKLNAQMIQLLADQPAAPRLSGSRAGAAKAHSRPR